MKLENCCNDCHTDKGITKYSKGKYIFVLAFIVLLMNLLTACWIKWEPTTIISDVSHYGHYIGTGADSFVKEYINSFFPAQIEDCFSGVNYIYKAASWDNYDFEAYLEFTIEDPDVFHDYVKDVAPEDRWETFAFDADYQIYLLENGLDLLAGDITDKESDLYHPIECARIRAVLYHEETRTIIFWALGVYDGGGVGTNYLNTFFNRFGIDPVIYEQTADSPYDKSPFGLD